MSIPLELHASRRTPKLAERRRRNLRAPSPVTVVSRAPRAAFAKLVLAAWLGGACQSAKTASSESAAGSLAELVSEGATLGSLLSFNHLLVASLVIALALGAGRFFDWVVRVAWRLGFDPHRRLGRAANIARLLFLGFGALVVLRSAAHAAPLFTSAFLLLLLIGGLFAPGYVPSVLVGISLAVGRRLQIGDRVKLGEHEGVVRSMGLSRLQLRSDDGSSIVIPNRLLNHAPVRIDRARNSVPVRVQLRLAEPISAELLEQLRRVACLSPYRAPGSTVNVARADDDDRRLTVDIQAWSERARRDAQAQLEASLRASLPASSQAGSP